jgi:hypothetical protein
LWIGQERDGNRFTRGLKHFCEQSSRLTRLRVADDDLRDLVMDSVWKQSKRHIHGGVTARDQSGQNSSCLGTGIAQENLRVSSPRGGRLRSRIIFTRLAHFSSTCADRLT